MTPQLTIALQSDKRWRRYGELAELVEQRGFDGLSIYGDLGFQPPLPGLLRAAEVTSRLRLGPACLNPFVVHPLEIAGQHAALDDASDGRAYLGLARGSWLDRIGVDQPRPVSALADTIAIVRRLFAGDDSGFEGPTFSLAPGMRLEYEPRRRDVEILLGVWGPQGAKLAGAVADDVKVGGSANPDMTTTMRSWLDAAATANGRAPTDVRLALGAVTVTDDDGAAARQLARREVVMYLEVIAALDPTVDVEPELLERLAALRRAGALDEMCAQLPDSLLRRFAFAGTPHEIAQHALEVFAAGADRIEFGTPHGITDEGGISRLADVATIVRGELG